MGSRKLKENLITTLHDKYKVRFMLVDSIYLTDTTLPIEQQLSLLNIFNRRKMEQAQFVRIAKGWFYGRPNEMRDERLQNVRLENCEIVRGFECSVQVQKPRITNGKEKSHI